jgi:hypothetical protein
LFPEQPFVHLRLGKGRTVSARPYIAVCRFQMAYLGKPASDLGSDKVKRGYAALARMEHQLALTRFLVDGNLSLADVWLLAYTRLSHAGASTSTIMPAGSARAKTHWSIAGALTQPESVSAQELEAFQVSGVFTISDIDRRNFDPLGARSDSLVIRSSTWQRRKRCARRHRPRAPAGRSNYRRPRGP